MDGGQIQNPQKRKQFTSLEYNKIPVQTTVMQ